ncbi:YtxH domain-containing protein [Streptomyces sp. SID1121]|uniref:YtxH domain-containing protein n=1 Tax=Streptomyces sp. SID1121 TaxID=3425888 RepID=UPI0040576517
MRYRLTFIAGVAFGYVIGTRAGRERYEQLKKSARQVSQNPAVRNAAETASTVGREYAGKAYHSVSAVVGDKVGDRMPGSVASRVRSLRERSQNGRANGSGQDDWGSSAT